MNTQFVSATDGIKLDWGSVEPNDLPCSTLWLAGTKNEGTITSMEIYEGSLADSLVQTHILDGLNHMEEFEAIERTLPPMLRFTA